MQRKNDRITRRTLLAGAARTAASAAVASVALGAKAEPARAELPAVIPPGIRIWDMHGHLNGVQGSPKERLEKLMKFAARMGIERQIFYMGYPFVFEPTAEEIRRQNDQVLDALKGAGDRAFGFVYVNPTDRQGSLDEINRCIRDGPMVGVKLWVAVRCCEPCVDPIVERALELNVPILQHTWRKITGNQPGESTATDLAVLARRHPNATFLAAHTNGDWEVGIRAIRSVKNVTAEISGGDPAAGLVDMAVRELGAERVMYGSDIGGRSYASQLAKVLGADISQDAKELILGGNIRRALGPVLSAKGIDT